MGSARYAPGFRRFSRKTKVICDDFCDYALEFEIKILGFTSPKLGLERLNDPNLIGSKECLRVRLM